MNLAAITLLRFLQYNDEFSPFYMGGKYNNLFVFAIGVIILTVALGVMEYKITTWVQEKIFGSPKPATEPVTRISLLDDADDTFSRKMSMFRKDELGLAKAEAVSNFETVEETSLREKPKKKKKKSKK